MTLETNSLKHLLLKCSLSFFMSYKVFFYFYSYFNSLLNLYALKFWKILFYLVDKLLNFNPARSLYKLWGFYSFNFYYCMSIFINFFEPAFTMLQSIFSYIGLIEVAKKMRYRAWTLLVMGNGIQSKFRKLKGEKRTLKKSTLNFLNPNLYHQSEL